VYSCLLLSFADILNVEPDVLKKEIGHNGDIKVWEDLPEPICYNGYHFMEFYPYCLKVGKVPLLIDFPAVSASPYSDVTHEVKIKMSLPYIIENFSGIAFGISPNNIYHAVPFANNNIGLKHNRIEWHPEIFDITSVIVLFKMDADCFQATSHQKLFL